MKKFALNLCLIFLFFNLNSLKADWVKGSGTDSNIVYYIVNCSNNLFAATYNPATYNYNIFISVNNGLNWQQTSLVNQVVTTLAAGGGIVFAGTNDSGIFRSSNNGINWVHIGLNDLAITSLAIKDSNIFAGTMDSGVYLSSNNGVNWSQSGLNGIDVTALVTNGNTIIAGTIANYPYGGVHLSSDNGINWYQIGLNTRFTKCLAVSTNFLYAGTIGNGIYKTTNTGINWTQIGLNNKTVNSITATGENVFASANDSVVYFSTNGGMNWISNNEGFSPNIVIYFLFISNDWIIAGTNRGAWRRPIFELIEIKNINQIVPHTYSLSQNYPNPFNPTTKIKFEIPKSDYVKLVVYDVLGREVATLVNQQLKPGSYEAEWDASNYASGIYFYTLTTESFNQTKIMVLVK